MTDAATRGTGELPALEITIPGETGFLEVLRGVAARVGHIARFTYDGVEDVALSVNEAASLVMRAQPAELHARLVIHPDRVVAEVRGRNPAREWPLPRLQSATAWQILVALCDEVSASADGVVFELSRR